MILNNLKSKYKQYYNIDACNIETNIEMFILLKEVVVHLPLDKYTAKIPASFCRFHFNNLSNEHRNLLNFALETGVGERNSSGLGFLNVEEGAEIVRFSEILESKDN
jgi:CRISPR-associated endoribonuclease Cas6